MIVETQDSPLGGGGWAVVQCSSGERISIQVTDDVSVNRLLGQLIAFSCLDGILHYSLADQTINLKFQSHLPDARKIVKPYSTQYELVANRVDVEVKGQDFEVGDTVRHYEFGTGNVLAVLETARTPKVRVKFLDGSIKSLSLSKKLVLIKRGTS